jgi:hypothetical protein
MKGAEANFVVRTTKSNAKTLTTKPMIGQANMLLQNQQLTPNYLHLNGYIILITL